MSLALNPLGTTAWTVAADHLLCRWRLSHQVRFIWLFRKDYMLKLLISQANGESIRSSRRSLGDPLSPSEGTTKSWPLADGMARKHLFFTFARIRG